MRAKTLLLSTAFAALLAGSPPVLADVDPIGAVSQQKPSDAIGIGATSGAERPLPYQAAVYQNDIVVTKNEGTQLQFRDTTLLTVSSNSKVTLDSFAFQKDTGSLAGKISLGGGVLRLVTGSLVKHEDLRIVTATTTLTIRGTDILVEADHDGTTLVRVYEGVIRLKTCNNAWVTVKAGERAVVSPKCVAVVQSASDGKIVASAGDTGTGPGSVPGAGDGSTGPGGTPGGGPGGTPGGDPGGTPGGDPGHDPGTGNGGPGLGNGGVSNGKGNGGDPGKR